MKRSGKVLPKASGSRLVGVGDISQGVVRVLRTTEKAILITGGDTTGENWIPRKEILNGVKGCLRRDAKTGDEGELWLPSWLSDRIPW